MQAAKKTDPKQNPILLHQLNQARIVFRPIPGSSEVQMTCPFCGKENHFYVNIYKRVGLCQRCKEPAGYRRLVEVLRLPVMGMQLTPAPTVIELRETYNQLFGHGRIISSSSELPSCDLPLGAHPAYRYPAAMKYLMKRGLPLRDIQRFDVRYCPFGPYFGRVLFPVYVNDRLVGFNTRSIKSNKHPKYLTNKNFPSARVLYPMENLNMGRLVITEGCIPAVWCQGVATFGKKFSDEQMKLLLKHSKTIKQVVLAWDRDAWASDNPNSEPPALKAWTKIKKYFPCAGLILPEEEPQPDKMSKTSFQSSLELVWKKDEMDSGIYNVSTNGSVALVG